MPVVTVGSFGSHSCKLRDCRLGDFARADRFDYDNSEH